MAGDRRDARPLAGRRLGLRLLPRRFANYAAYYAGLASVVTAIFFLYLIVALMIFGAEFNAALARRASPE